MKFFCVLSQAFEKIGSVKNQSSKGGVTVPESKDNSIINVSRIKIYCKKQDIIHKLQKKPVVQIRFEGRAEIHERNFNQKEKYG